MLLTDIWQAAAMSKEPHPARPKPKVEMTPDRRRKWLAAKRAEQARRRRNERG